MVDMWKIVLILNVLYAVRENVSALKELGEGKDYTDIVFDDPDSENLEQFLLTGSVYHNLKRYYCSLNNSEILDSDPFKILYATNEWRFPRQDVNLTLVYPTSDNVSDYTITSVDLFLFYDGTSSCHGYITAGGIGRDKISLTFIIPGISRLYYQFRLEGVEKTNFDVSKFSNATLDYIC